MYTGKYTLEDIEQMENAGVKLGEVDAQWKMFPDQDLVTVIGSVVTLKMGMGQERTEPFTPNDEKET